MSESRSPDGDGVASTYPSKRRRWKRASTACQVCRRRKAKCDNKRPQCGFCVRQKAICVYDDDDPDEVPRYDAATQEILARLDSLKDSLQDSPIAIDASPLLQSHKFTEQKRSYATSQQGQSRAAPGRQRSCATAERLQSCATFQRQQQPHPTSETWLSGTQTGRIIPFQRTACESLIQWPVFRDILVGRDKQISSFLFDVSHPKGPIAAAISPPPAKSRDFEQESESGLDTSDFLSLCLKFLENVHPRNPVLEPTELVSLAKEYSLHGLKWTGSCCLILVCCAIACITTPWSQSQGYFDAISTVEEDKILAETYFCAARKRIGLLGDSIIDLRCFFFASIYEKHLLRPIEAFCYLQQLSYRLEMLQLRQRLVPVDPSEHRWQETLLFSCLKAQSELQPEIGINSSSFWSPILSDDLPHPPCANDYDGSLIPDSSLEIQERQGWLFYMSEISLRRRIQETLASLYCYNESAWPETIDQLQVQYYESQAQIDLWYSHLPESLKFEQDRLPSNEFAFYLQGRFHEWTSLVLRPFFYCIVHHDPVQGQSSDVSLLAQSYIDRCTTFISHMSYHGRHGGTWFVCRHTFAAGMSILASVLAGFPVTLSETWIGAVRLALRTLYRWKSEARDVAAMAEMLDKVFWEVCRQHSINPLQDSS